MLSPPQKKPSAHTLLKSCTVQKDFNVSLLGVGSNWFFLSENSRSKTDKKNFSWSFIWQWWEEHQDELNKINKNQWEWAFSRGHQYKQMCLRISFMEEMPEAFMYCHGSLAQRWVLYLSALLVNCKWMNAEKVTKLFTTVSEHFWTKKSGAMLLYYICSVEYVDG